MTEGLLHCASCGHDEPQLLHCNKGFFIVCENCGRSTSCFDTSADAANYWNYLYLNNKSEVQNES